MTDQENTNETFKRAYLVYVDGKLDQIFEDADHAKQHAEDMHSNLGCSVYGTNCLWDRREKVADEIETNRAMISEWLEKGGDFPKNSIQQGVEMAALKVEFHRRAAMTYSEKKALKNLAEAQSV